ncbi:LutC/YkgG family protein [Neolewinella antarctica]|uniref:L-lactate dehydrogenase complex protein LldG n=1 Tax=Neolewinella antarctica TaxID=442734 RepID=A0ABX0XFN8_9BACT|nr:LUD domain-containing protein [Neolewinella antarctica]NJC28135.1 L-lactate dehydrogenase complex protein LldG [Neolewinella antarctica]
MPTAKEHILARVRANKPADRPLPDMPTYDAEVDLDLPLFTEVIGGSKGKVMAMEDLPGYLATNFPDAKVIASTVPEIPGNIDLAAVKDPLELALVDIAVLRGRFAVAENGAIWVTEKEAVIRVLPFITQHLVLVIDGGVVPTMHEAYKSIDIAETGFGVFIAGPSKTADIEQSLVIGAHGPRSLGVVFV